MGGSGQRRCDDGRVVRLVAGDVEEVSVGGSTIVGAGDDHVGVTEDLGEHSFEGIEVPDGDLVEGGVEDVRGQPIFVEEREERWRRRSCSKADSKVDVQKSRGKNVGGEEGGAVCCSSRVLADIPSCLRAVDGKVDVEEGDEASPDSPRGKRLLDRKSVV